MSAIMQIQLNRSTFFESQTRLADLHHLKNTLRLIERKASRRTWRRVTSTEQGYFN